MYKEITLFRKRQLLETFGEMHLHKGIEVKTTLTLKRARQDSDD